MKITLVYPGFSEDPSGLQEPLGILYIASMLRKEGHKVSLIDLTFKKDKNVLKKAAKSSDLIGMSATSLIFENAKQTLKEIKKTNPKVLCFLGGSHATLSPEEALKEGFDYAIIGEGETTTVKLANAINKQMSEKGIDGLAFKKNNKIIINPKKTFIEDFNKLPFPARDLWNYNKYFKTGTSEIGIIATRGCPYNCLYCKPMVDKLFGNKIRKRSPKNVVEEIEQIAKDYKHLFKLSNKSEKGLEKSKTFQKRKVKLWFKDDTLTLCGIDWFKEFKKELKERNLKIDWGCHTRVDNVNYELLKIMKECGLTHISFGVESGSQKILNYYRKGTTPEQAIKAFKACKKLGIQTFAYFMIGAPIETREDLEKTYQLIKKIKPDGLDVFTTVPYPGNNLYDLLKKNKQLKEGEINYYSKQSLIKMKYLTDKDLDKYRRKMYRVNNINLTMKYFTSVKEFKKLVKYIIKRPGFVINYLKRSL